MRRQFLIWWSTAAVVLSIMLTSSHLEHSRYRAKRTTTLLRVAIVPICNPGLACDPDLPRRLGRSFFRGGYGVANFIQDVSLGNTRIVGHVLPWQRPSKRIKNPQELMAKTDEFLAIAKHELDDVDVVFFYLKQSGHGREYVNFTQRRAYAPTKTPARKIVYLVNSDIYATPTYGKIASTITPSTSWALLLLKSIGFDGNANILRCDSFDDLASCTMRRSKDPYSLFGDMAFSLSVPSVFTTTAGDTAPHTTIVHDGNYRVDGTRSRLTVNLKKPLKLNDSLQFDRLYIEQRALTKFDRRLMELQKDLSSSSRSAVKSHAHGAFLYLGSSTNSSHSTLLIDANPEIVATESGARAAFLAELSDMALVPGKSFKVFDTSITVEVTRMSASSLTINVAGLSQ